MTAVELAELYERDLQKLINEIQLFQDERNLWKTVGLVKNSSGNLALYIIRGLNFLIGTTLAGTGYLINRDQEFELNGVDRGSIVKDLKRLIPLIKNTVRPMAIEQLNERYPRFFEKKNATISYVLTQLLLHLNYHTGQVNYLRRTLEL